MAEESINDQFYDTGENTDLIDDMADKAGTTAKAVNPAEVEETNHECPCEAKLYNAKLIACLKCDVWWHAACVGLKELTKPNISKLKSWLCPFCYELPPKAKERYTKKVDVSTLANIYQC